MALGLHWEREHLSGGRYRHVQHLKPIAFRNNAGQLERIVSAIEDGQFPGAAHQILKAAFWVSITNGGEIRYHPTREVDVRFVVGDPVYRLGGDVKHYDLGTPERSGNRLTWQTQHVRMDFIHGGHYGKLGMLFKTGAYQSIDNREFAFPITYYGCTRNGRNIVVDGETVMRLRGFTAYDYDDDTGENRAQVEHEWRTIGGQEYIVVTLPQAMDGWSKPVLDPTFEVQPDATAGMDAALDPNNPNLNLGSAGWYVSYRYRTVAKFDLSSIPSGATITSATLYLTQYQAYLTGTDFYLSRILSGNDGWTESGCTWNSKDGSNAWAGTAGCSTSGTDYASTPLWSGDPSLTLEEKTFTLDTTEFALMLANNYGLVHHRAPDGANYRFHRSSDYETAADRPKLTIEYTEGAAVNEIWNHPFVHSESFGNPFG